MGSRICLLLVAMSAHLAACSRVEAGEPPNVIYAALVETPQAQPREGVRLPPPTMADGLDVDGQRKVLKTLADDSRPLEALLRKSVVAPFVLKISDDRTSGAGLSGTGRRVDVWFVVHGDFARLTSEDFLLDQLTPDAKANQEKSDFQGRTLTASELEARSIALASNERLVHLDFNLFDRVQMSVTSQAMLTRSDDSAIVAGRLDPRFHEDRLLPNRWQPLSRDSLGRLKAGQSQPYQTAGWYLKATRLHEPAGSVLMEYHLAFDEPHDWFDGANLLRSKLPLVTQDAVRRFRRKAAEMN
jgi:hypothetical protein